MGERSQGQHRAEADDRPRSVGGAVYAFLVSPRLAIALLVAVLACCVAGATVVRGERAWALIFSTAWFNGLLVLLALSSGAAFFTRIWRRKLTLLSAGMILFHVSFVALLGGVVYNSLHHFKGVLRLTEGETLPNGELSSYDSVEAGRLFDFGRLTGSTTLVKMHRGYTVDGLDKRAAYEIEVGEGNDVRRAIIYVTADITHRGIRYLNSKEGYSLVVALREKGGGELVLAALPLQSLRHQDGSYLYVTGTSTEPRGTLLPAPPAPPRAEVLVTYRPDAVKERAGEVGFKVIPIAPDGAPGKELEGSVKIGEVFEAGDLSLVAEEVRYWAAMDVRHDPGLGIVLASLTSGLLGMVLTFVGRLRQGGRRKTTEAGSATQPAPRTTGW